MCDYKKLIEFEKLLIFEEKKRLGLLHDSEAQIGEQNEDYPSSRYNDSCETSEANCLSDKLPSKKKLKNNGDSKNLSKVERLNLYSANDLLKHQKNKEEFINQLCRLENPLTFRTDSNESSMLRCGQYSPNNPQLRVSTAPYLGLGEYEQRRELIKQQLKEDYRNHISQKQEHSKSKSQAYYFKESSNRSKTVSSKSVQTDIQDITKKLIQYELHSQNPPEKELKPQSVPNSVMYPLNRNEQRMTNAQVPKPENFKPKSILSTRAALSPRERLIADLKHSFGTNFVDGFGYEDRLQELERERYKRETYQAELLQQIEEKKRLQLLKQEQERQEQILENQRLEQQLMKIREEQMLEDQKRAVQEEQFRRANEELIRTKRELQERMRNYLESEKTTPNSYKPLKKISHYSPPPVHKDPYSSISPNDSRLDKDFQLEPRYRTGSLNRKEPLSRMQSLNRQGSLTQLETVSLNDNHRSVPRRHSATQEANFSKSPKPLRNRRTNYSNFEDALPIPLLKVHSPVAKDLKNSVAVNSSQSESGVQHPRNKWQVPVQKNSMCAGDSRDNKGKNILSQLGTIRMQLQKEQMKMDETLKKRGITQYKAV